MTGLIHEHVARMIVTGGDRPAVSAGDGTFTYAQLGDRAYPLAHRLRALGAGPDTVVAVLADPASRDAPAAALAVWAAGAVYLPLDPGTLAERRAAMLAGTRPVAVVSTAALAPGLPPGGWSLVLLDDEPGPAPAGPPDVPMSPENLAYIIHTSGSTGEPKPVAVPHRAIMATFRSWVDHYDIYRTVRSHLQVAGPSFDAYVGDLVRALASGGKLVLTDRHLVLDPPRLLDLIERTAVHAIDVTPAVLRLLIEHLETTGRTLRVPQIVVGGEEWPVAEARRLFRLAPGSRLLHVYGIAETAVDCSFFDVTEAALDSDRLPIGRTFPHLSPLILDERLRPVPPGTPGQLFLYGAGLAQGYYDRPEDTAERFVPAIAGPPGARMYRTGDLVMCRPDGEMVFLGRVDDEVKIRGVRGSISSVETALGRHPQVLSAAVLRVDRAGEPVLVAHVVSRTAGDDGLARQLRADLAATLPAAFVPAGIRFRATMPITAAGKIDRTALASAGTGPVAPASAATLADLWAELLGQPPRDGQDDLFGAGGSSLTAARLAAAVRSRMGVDLPVEAVFADPTPDGIAAAIAASVARPAPAGPAGIRTAATLSPAQQRLWLLHRLDPADSRYHVPMLLEITGPLRPDLLEQALRTVADRHDALRLRIDGRPAGPFHLDRAGADASRAELVRVPFDLATGPSWRATLIAYTEKRHDLLIVVHHIVFDGWSERIVLDELGRVYAALVTGTPLDLPAPAVSFAEVAAWQSQRLADDVLAPQLAYWHEKLNDPPPPLELAGAPAARAGRSGELSVRLPGTPIRSAARAHRTTDHVVLLTAFALLLGRWSGQTDLIVGVPYATRDRPELDDVVGFLVTTLALRLSVSSRVTMAEALRATGETVARAAANAEAPFDRVLADLGLAGARGRNPLIRVWFNMLGAPTPAPTMPGLQVRLADPPEADPLFDLSVYVTEEPDGFRLRLVYDTAAVGDADVAALVDQYEQLTAALCAEPDRPAGHHRLRTSTGRVRLPDDTADLRGDAPPALLPTLRSVALAAPAALAVTSPDEHLSYAALHAAVRSLAARLRLAGVRPGDVVPVLAARTPELVTGLLAVLYAGGTIAVLDAGHPARHLAAQLAVLNARTGLLVSAAGPVAAELRSGCPVWIDGSPSAIGEAEAEAAFEAEAAAAPMYVAFTSGTTGAPQGIVGGAAPVAHFLGWYTEMFGIGAGDRFAMLAGLSHDPLFRDVLAPLWTGATLAVPPDELLRAPLRLRHWLAAERITVLHLTPPLARLLATPRTAPLSAARLIVLAGDQLRAGDVERIRRFAPDALLVNGYGATETPQLAGLGVLTTPPGSGSVPVGTGAPGAQLLVVDAEGRPAGVGERGQIVVRGPHLAEGYLGPDAPDRFTDDPVPGHRRFATGDLGRHGSDGAVTVLGRIDDQLTVGANRIEPAEVEARLREHPAVADAVVTVRPGPGGAERLVAYLVPEGRAAAPGPAELRGFLRAQLPEPRLPAAVVEIAAVPLTRNGKPDRAVLPAPVPAAGPGAAAPESAMELAVAEVWRVVLGTPDLPADLNFFDAGGTSLMMAAAQAGLEEGLGREVPVTALFEYPTVRSLARHLAGRPEQQPPARAPRPDRRSALDRRLAARSADGEDTR